MHTLRRFLVLAIVPAVIVSVFAAGSVAAHGSSGKVEMCHWASNKFVKITVSTNAEPAHLKHGDVEADEYGDCDGDHDGNHEGNGGSGKCQGSRAKWGHVFHGWELKGNKATGDHKKPGK